MLQTEPQMQEVLGIDERGHDFFLQLTDARPDTGGLSGATPGEAVSWGKIDPDMLPGTVVCYMDNTVSFPLLTAYAMARYAPRPLRRLFGRREEMMERLVTAYRAALNLRDRRARGETTPLAQHIPPTQPLSRETRASPYRGPPTPGVYRDRIRWARNT